MPWKEKVIVTMREEFVKRDYLLFIDFTICYRILPAFIYECNFMSLID